MKLKLDSALGGLLRSERHRLPPRGLGAQRATQGRNELASGWRGGGSGRSERGAAGEEGQQQG